MVALVTEDGIAKAFKSEKLSPKMLASCFEQCRSLYLSPLELKDYWDAYSCSYDIKTLDATTLDQFKKYVADDVKSQNTTHKKTPIKTPVSSKRRGGGMAGARGNNDFDKDSLHLIDPDMFAFDTPQRTPSSTTKRQSYTFATPDTKKRGVHRGGASGSDNSPNTFASPISTNFTSRTNAGNVELTFNERIPAEFKVPPRNDGDIAIGVYRNAQMTNYRYMFEKLSEVADAMDYHIERLGYNVLCRRHKITETSHVRLARQVPVSIVGRVCCDSEGRLNDKSLMLEGTRDESAGERVSLDMSEMPAFSLFPGQVIAAEGLNTSGNHFVMNKVFTNARRQFAHNKPSELRKHCAVGGLRFVCAAGPFTCNDDLSYQPLDELLESVKKDAPDVLILMGPFVDETHPMIINPTGGLQHSTYQEVFDDCIGQRLADLMERTRTLQVVLVPSLLDIQHDRILPQPPLPLAFENDRIKSMPNPCVLTVNEVTIGLSTTDILFALISEEISRTPSSSAAGDRLGRLTNHLLEQRSFYPLYPSKDDVSIDYERLDQLEMPTTPDILLIPSNMKYFAKNVSECLAINPGRLTRAKSGGTYTKFVVHAMRRNDIHETEEDKPVRHNVVGRSRVEICRI
eukprot:CFRG7842T1